MGEVTLEEAQEKFGYKNVREPGLFGGPILIKNSNRTWYPLLENVLTKNQLIAIEIAKKYHPEYIKDSKKTLLRKAYTLKTELIFEECLPLCCPHYTWTPKSYQDFSNGDDAKSASVRREGIVEINDIGHKIGSLRTVIYNPYKERLDYLFIPFDRDIGTTRICLGRKRLFFRWSYKLDNYGQFEKYRVGSFEELAWTKGIDENGNFIKY